MKTEILLAARSAVGKFTPLYSDCGALCNRACCLSDEDGKGGVYLFPGEEALLGSIDWGHIVEDAFAPMLLCDRPCVRAYRPLACRIFPLTPFEAAPGFWNVRLDVRARPVCPLAAGSIRQLRPDFVRSVRKAVQIIIQEPEGETFLRRWAALEAQYYMNPEELIP